MKETETAVIKNGPCTDDLRESLFGDKIVKFTLSGEGTIAGKVTSVKVDPNREANDERWHVEVLIIEGPGVVGKTLRGGYDSHGRKSVNGTASIR